MLLIEYLFYRFFLFQKKFLGEVESAYRAAIFTAIMLVINFITIWGLLFRYKLLILPKPNPIVVLLIIAFFVTMVCFYFIHKKKYLQLVVRFEKGDLSLKYKKLWGWLIILYVLVSFGAFYFGMIFAPKP